MNFPRNLISKIPRGRDFRFQLRCASLTMNVTFACPACEQTSVAPLSAGVVTIACQHCGHELAVPTGAVAEGKINACVVCPSQELYLRKNFPQQLGVAIVALAAIISSVFWFYRQPMWAYATLFVAALIDLAVYFLVGNLLQCYRCQSQYREVPGLDDHEAFNLETHERHRQQVARLSQSHSQSQQPASTDSHTPSQAP